MRQPNFYSAVFAIIKNEKGETLFQQRQNTGFRDGMYQLPSGHLEGSESMKAGLIRELKEELNIEVSEKDMNILHISHVVCPDRVYFNIYIEILKYSGVLKNLETEKCSEIVFKDFSEIKNDEKYLYDTETLKRIFDGEKFSEKIGL